LLILATWSFDREEDWPTMPGNVIIASVLEIFGTIDGQVAAFQLCTGMQCPSGCGPCCLSREVRTTLVEMLPAAAEILRRGEEDPWLARIESSGDNDVCVFYNEIPEAGTGGGCRMYPWRPSVCRLFGFAAVQDKHGRPELAVCKYIKELDPDRIARARQAIGAGIKIPLFTAYSVRLAGVAPWLGAKLMPVNAALKSAIEYLGLTFRFEGPSGKLAAKAKRAA
jgi:Fe-S-cluster containining protein